MTSKNSSLAKSVNNFGIELKQLQTTSYKVINPPQATKNNMMQKLMMFLMFLIMLGMGGMGMRLFAPSGISPGLDPSAAKNAPNTVASTSTVKESSQSALPEVERQREPWRSNKQPVQNTEPSYLPSPSASQEVCEDPTVCEKSPSAGPQTRFEFSQSEQ